MSERVCSVDGICGIADVNARKRALLLSRECAATGRTASSHFDLRTIRGEGLERPQSQASRCYCSANWLWNIHHQRQQMRKNAMRQSCARKGCIAYVAKSYASPVLFPQDALRTD